MFWILRRTRLSSSAFFNAINNNLAGSGCLSNRNGTQANVGSRKGYSTLLSSEGDGEEEESGTAGEREHIKGDNGGSSSSCSSREDVPTEEGDDDSLCYSDYEMSEDSDYEESLTCNVCDRYFPTARLLAHHQQKKRHFGCSACENLFPSLMALEHHKEELDHWSEGELAITEDDSEGRGGGGKGRGGEDGEEDERPEDHLKLLL